jgi:hypothetical protein
MPLKRKSTPTSLHIILNNEQFNFKIYDEDGLDSDKVYFKGAKIIPSFFLKTSKQNFRIDFKSNKIEIIEIKENFEQEPYLKNFCSFISPKSECWAVSKYYTSRPEKPPFNEM